MNHDNKRTRDEFEKSCGSFFILLATMSGWVGKDDGTFGLFPPILLGQWIFGFFSPVGTGMYQLHVYTMIYLTAALIPTSLAFPH